MNNYAIIGWPTFSFHHTITGALVVDKGCQFVTPHFTFNLIAGDVINGASVPWLFTFMFNRYDPEYVIQSGGHDVLVGELGEKKKVKFNDGTERELTWEESAKAFRELMKLREFIVGGKSVKVARSRKATRRIFYHAVMSKKRVGLKD